ncbi:MAG: type IV secretory system conjugative DNA transfer family protein [Phycisphaeraceae bacterium]
MATPVFAQQALQQARPLVRRALAEQLLVYESIKGCSRVLAPGPMSLTPPLTPLEQGPFGLVQPDPTGQDDKEQPPPQGPRVWFHCAIHPDYPPRAREYESFLRLMAGAKHGFMFEVSGNHAEVAVRIGVYPSDIPVLKIAMSALHMTMGDGYRLDQRFPTTKPWVSAFVPRPPYADVFTRLDELPHPPVGLMVQALHGIPAPAIGLYQVCAEAVRDDGWTRNAQQLHDARFRTRLEPGMPEGAPSLAWSQQVPSGSLQQLSQDTFTKTHPDRAFFFAISRVAFYLGSGCSNSASANVHLQCLAAPINLILQNGRPMDTIPPEAFLDHFATERLLAMLEEGLVYRHGVLMNSEELASFVHLPSSDIIENLRLHNLRCEPLVPPQADDSERSDGTRIGQCIDGSQHIPANVSSSHRPRHTTIIGKNGTGKSTLLQAMSLDDAARGEGMLVIDPHGFLVRDLANRLPTQLAKRTRWIDFEDPEYALLFNPFRFGGGKHSLKRAANFFIDAFKVMTGGWGDRLEHLLRCFITAAATMPQGSLLDIVTALERDTDQGEATRKQMLEYCTDPLINKFLKHFKSTYKSTDTNPVHHKLSKLLLAGPASLTLRQPDNQLDFSGWMEHGDIVLADLGSISGEFKQLLGSFLIASVYAAAFARESLEQEPYRPFHLVVDEAHRFSDVLLADMIAETRKFKVGLTLAHQYLRQFSSKTIDALGTAGTSIVFNVDSGDAEALARTMRKRVSVEQIIALNDFEAYARIGNNPIHIHTPHFRDLPEGDGCLEAIKQRSYQDWYAPRRQLEAQINATIRGIPTPPPGSTLAHGSASGNSRGTAPTQPKEVLSDDLNWPS